MQRTHNYGITTEVIAEQDTDDALQAELAQVLFTSHRGARAERGFSMTLDGALERRYPGIQLIIARDRSGQVQGFHRYATAGGGSGCNPRRTVAAARRTQRYRRAAQRGHDPGGEIGWWATAVSLAFAAFPEIFDNKNRNRLQGLIYHGTHLLDSFIALESLYRYLRKFHALDDRRYVVLSLRHVLPAAIVLLSLEFMPRRRRLT